MSKIQVVVIDDHMVVRVGMRSIIERDQRFSMVGEGESLTRGLEVIEEKRPDVVLLDFRLPDGDGVIGTKRIKSRFPETKILILTAHQNKETVMEVLKAGADGYILKSIESKKILEALVKTYEGEGYLDASIAGVLVGEIQGKECKTLSEKVDLTPREETVMNLLCMGKSNKEIAAEMEIAEKTVRNYLTKIMEKLNVQNRTEAALFWTRTKLNNYD